MKLDKERSDLHYWTSGHQLKVEATIYKPKENIEVGDFVLQNFDEDEMLGIEKISNNIANSISMLVDKKLDLFSSTINNK